MMPFFDQSKPKTESKEKIEPEIDDPLEKIRSLIRFQKANGSFGLEAVKLFIPNVTEDTLKTNIAIEVTADIVIIFITAIVVALFEKKFPSQKINWNLVVKKANSWIKKESIKAGIPEDFDWSRSASNFLSSM